MGEELIALTVPMLFLLGLRHTLDVDHLAAVTAIVSKRRQGALDAASLGGAFAFGHFLSAVVFGAAGLALGIEAKALVPEALKALAGYTAGILVVLLGAWIIRGCALGKCYERRERGSKWPSIDWGLPRVEAPNCPVFALPVLGWASLAIYRAAYKVLVACSICLSNWVGFLFSISPPLPAVVAFLSLAASGDLLGGIVLSASYGFGIFLGMTLVGGLEGRLFGSLLVRSLRAHDRALWAVGTIVILAGLWFLLAWHVDLPLSPWEHL